MTIPIARVVATRYADAEPPLRFCYVAHAYRARARRSAGSRARSCRPASSWSARPAPEGTAEALDACCARRSTRPGCDATASGSATRRCTRALLDARRRARRGARRRSCTSSSTRDFVGLEREVERARPGPRAASCCALPQLRGGAGGARRRPGGGRRGAARRCYDAARAATSRERVIFDLGLVARRSATTRARSSRSTTPRSARRSAAAGATTTCSAASAAPLPAVRLGADVERLHLALAGRGARRARER